MDLNKKECWNQWANIAQRKVNSHNIDLCEMICCYSEFVFRKREFDLQAQVRTEQSYSDSFDMVDKSLDQVAEKLRSLDKFEVVGIYGNHITGLLEYKLSNGKFVPIDGRVEYNYNLDNDFISTIFGLDFLKVIRSAESYRDFRISKVLENGRTN